MKELPVQKNQELTVEIIDLTHEGLGVAKVDHYPLFIENALPGESVDVLVVKVGKSFGYAKVLNYNSTSQDRVESADQDLLRTGIAPISHMTYARQLQFKEEQVKNVMERIAKMAEVEVLPTIGMENPTGYRNKAQIPVRKLAGELATGFYRKNSHQLLPIENFLIQDPKIDEAVVVIRDLARRFNIKAYNEESNTGFLRHIVVRRGHYSHEMMVVLVTRTEKFFNGKTFAKVVAEALPEVVSVVQNVNPDKTNVIMGKQNITLTGKDTISDTLLGNTYQISAQSFYQINSEQAEKLYQTAIDFAELKATDVVVDAYCGIGTIGQSLAKQVKHVYGVEVVQQAIDDARKNAELNGLDNVTYQVGKAERVMGQWTELEIKPDVIFVDPPRKGLDASFVEASAESKPEKIVYISCNPATFARDVKLYAELGYTLQKVQPVDLFPQTVHVETVALMTRKK